MTTHVRTRIVRIGNSQGVRIPKVLLDQAQLGDEVELEVGDEHIVIRPVARARKGWEYQFELMAAQGDDVLLDGEAVLAPAWDDEEWEWQ